MPTPKPVAQPPSAIRALTVRQPMAWAIMEGIKPIENRSQPTRYRGPLLIHSAVAPTDAATLADGTPVPKRLVYGAILGSVTLVDCVELAAAPSSPFASGPWCWILRDPKPIAPIPIAGQLGLWTPKLVLSCDHCRKTQPVAWGVQAVLCCKCGRRFPCEWE